MVVWLPRYRIIACAKLVLTPVLWCIHDRLVPSLRACSIRVLLCKILRSYPEHSNSAVVDLLCSMLADAYPCPPYPPPPACVAYAELGVAKGRLFRSSSKIAPRQTRGKVKVPDSSVGGVSKSICLFEIHHPPEGLDLPLTKGCVAFFSCFASILGSAVRFFLNNGGSSLSSDSMRCGVYKDAANSCGAPFLCWSSFRSQKKNVLILFVLG